MAKKAPESIPEPAKRLRQLLNENGMTQKELAERIYIDARYVSMLACGTRGLSIDMASRIVNCFPGTRVQWLLGFDDYKTEPQRTLGVIKHQLGFQEITEELIKSHGYRVSHSQNHDFVTIMPPKGKAKRIPVDQYLNLIWNINYLVEGVMTLGFHEAKDSVHEFTGRWF